MSAAEKSLAAFRVTSVQPGSVRIGFAQPAEAPERQIAFADLGVSASDVARDLLSDMQSITAADEIPPTLSARRERAVRRVIKSAQRVGTTFTGRVQATGDDELAEYSILLGAGRIAYREPEPEIVQSVMFGHVFMADVELGRQRLRVKLPGGRDATLMVDDDILDDLPDALDRVVELRVSEARVGDEVRERVVGGFRVLEPAAAGVETPEKTATELAREQGLLLQPPVDYIAILDTIFETDDDAERFRAYLRDDRATA